MASMFTVAGGFPSAPSAIFLNSDLPRNDQFFVQEPYLTEAPTKTEERSQNTTSRL